MCNLHEPAHATPQFLPVPRDCRACGGACDALFGPCLACRGTGLERCDVTGCPETAGVELAGGLLCAAHALDAWDDEGIALSLPARATTAGWSRLLRAVLRWDETAGR